MSSWTVTVGGAGLGWVKSIYQELSNQEVCVLQMPSTSGNRTIVSSDQAVIVQYDSDEIWRGTLTDPRMEMGLIEGKSFDTVVLALSQVSLYTADYTASGLGAAGADVILTAILAGTGINVGECPTTTIAVRFEDTNRYYAALFLAQELGMDWWTTLGTTFNIGCKGLCTYEMKLNENAGVDAFDATNNGEQGVLVNGPTWVAGKFGYGVRCQTNDYINTQKNIGNILATEKRTWAFMMKAPSGATGTMMGLSVGNVKLTVSFFQNGARVTFRDDVLPIAITTFPSAVIDDNAWHSIIVTVDCVAGTVACYVDGVLDSSETPGLGQFSFGAQPMYFGSENDDGVSVDPVTDTSFDELMAFDTLLNLRQIAALGGGLDVADAMALAPKALQDKLNHTTSRSKQKNYCIIKGVDSTGLDIEGEAWLESTGEIVFADPGWAVTDYKPIRIKETKVATVADLQRQAAGKLRQQIRATAALQVPQNIDDAYDIFTGDFVMGDNDDILLADIYRVFGKETSQALVTLTLDVLVRATDRAIFDLKSLVELGIYPGGASTIPKGSQAWNSDVAFTTGADAHDDLNWGAGTISFADGTTQAINASAGVHVGLAVGTHYVYWTWGTAVLGVMNAAGYATAVGPDKGIIARVTVPALAQDAMLIEAYNSGGTSVGEGAIDPTTLATPGGWGAGDISTNYWITDDGIVHSQFDVAIGAVTGATAYAVGVRINGAGSDWTVVTSDNNTILVEGLAAGENYNVRVAAISKTGTYSAWSASVNKVAEGDSIAPAAPTNLVATAKPNGVLLEWDQNSETDLDHYQVRQDTGAGYSTIAYVSVTSYFWAAAAGDYDQTYSYRIRAVDHTGNVSTNSNTDTAAAAHVNSIDLAIEQRDWKSNLSFIWDDPNQDFDEYWLGAQGDEKATEATVEFSDGTSRDIELFTVAGKVDGTYVYYWDETNIVAGDYRLREVTYANYDQAVGAGKGIVAIVIVNDIGNEAPTGYMFNSYAALIGTGILSAYAVLSKNITAESIYGKDIATQISVGVVAGSAGIRMIGDNANIVGTAIGDAIGGNFVAGIWGFKAGPTRTFFLDPASGVINVYGDGLFGVRKADGTSVGFLTGTVVNLGLGAGNQDTFQLRDSGAGAQLLMLASQGHAVYFDGDNDRIVISNSYDLIQPITDKGVTLGNASYTFPHYTPLNGQPAASATYSGVIWCHRGGAGTVTDVDICVQNSANNWEWLRIGRSS